MWSIHHRHLWADLDVVEEPTDGGRVLAVGAFVLADPFEEMLRHLSLDYVQAVWQRLSPLLKHYSVQPDDLSWGCLHPGETDVPGVDRPEPSNFIGWTSRKLARFYEDPRSQLLDTALAQGKPLLRCAATWRSLKWSIAPDNYTLALRLIEAWCTDEIAFWHPDYVLVESAEPAEAWLEVGQALRANDQNRVDRAVAEARASYSPLGYRIVVRAYTHYAHAEPGLTVRLPLV